MATTSGTISGHGVTTWDSGTDYRISAKITWKRNSYSVENNSSNVTVSLSFLKNDDATTYGTGEWKLVINGTTYTGSSYAEITNSGFKTVFSKTITIKHNSDGTKSFSINASGSYIPGTSFTNTICSGTVELPAIPRASTISVSSSVAVGSAATLTITAKSSSFYHTATWKCGSATSTVDITTAGSSKTKFTIPTSWASQMPSSTSISATVTVQTYSDSGRTTKVGSAVSKTFTVTIPSSYVPSGTFSVSYSNTATLSSATYYLQNRTKATLKVTSGAAGTGSSLKSYVFKRGSTTIKTITTSSSSATFTETIPKTGAITYSVVITDKRGRTTTKTATEITVYAYAEPTLTVNSCWRSNSSGTMDKTSGKFVTVKATFGCSSVNSKNTVSCNVKYKDSTASSWSSTTALTSGTAKTINGGNTSGGFDLENTYDVMFTVKDAVGTTVTKTITVPTIFVTMDFKAGGTGVAIGKIAETNNLFDVGVNMHLKSYNTDYSRIDISVNSYNTRSLLYSSAGNFGLYERTSDSDGEWLLMVNSSGNVSIPNGRFTAPKSIVHGSVSITPSAANTATGKPVSWDAMAGTPHVIATPATTVPGTTVLGVGAYNVTTTGCTIYGTRKDTSAFSVHYMAIY